MTASIPDAKRREIQAHLTNLRSGTQVTQVDDRALPLFSALMAEAEKEGYSVKSLGGYSDRDIKQMNQTLTGHPSNHAYGMAIDINPGDNPQAPGSRGDVPQRLVDYAKSLGLSWGGDYKSLKDPMHFEFKGTPEAAQAAAQKIGLINQRAGYGAGSQLYGDRPVTPSYEQGSQPFGQTHAGTVGDPQVDKILETIRTRETGGGADGYTKPNSAGSSASGAYQFIDKTWQGLTKQLGIGTEYKRAMDAPAAIQDQVAAGHVKAILKQTGGDIRGVPKAWYTGNPNAPDSLHPKGPGNPLTVGQYANAWMDTYGKATGKGVNMPAGTGSSPSSGANFLQGPTDLYGPKFDQNVSTDIIQGAPSEVAGLPVGYTPGQATVSKVDPTPGLHAMALMYLANHPVASQHQGPANIYFNHDTQKFEVEPLTAHDPTVPGQPPVPGQEPGPMPPMAPQQGASIGAMQPVGVSGPTMGAPDIDPLTGRPRQINALRGLR